MRPGSTSRPVASSLLNRTLSDCGTGWVGHVFTSGDEFWGTGTSLTGISLSRRAINESCRVAGISCPVSFASPLSSTARVSSSTPTGISAVIDAHGQVSHPDPYTAAMQAIHDERIDEIIVSTFAPERSPWLRKNLVQRLHDDSKLPVEHVVLSEEKETVG